MGNTRLEKYSSQEGAININDFTFPKHGDKDKGQVMMAFDNNNKTIPSTYHR